MAKSKNLTDVLTKEIQDLYSAEVQLTKALPKMAKAASDENLRKGFEEHLAQTETHVSRLEQVAEIMGISVKGTTCQAMKGLIEEGGERIKGGEEGPARDASLICAAQKVEHYELSGYGTVRAFAETLGFKDAAKILRMTEDEEAATDKKLGQIAKRVNEAALLPAE